MAQRLAVDGAHVVISSRNQENVDSALAKLKNQGLSVSGMVCHAGSREHRQRLIESVYNFVYNPFSIEFDWNFFKFLNNRRWLNLADSTF